MKAPKNPTNQIGLKNSVRDSLDLDLYEEEELIFAFVAAVGVDLTIAEKALETRLLSFRYKVEEIKITRSVLPKINSVSQTNFSNDYTRIGKMMDIGTEARGAHGTDILAKGISSEINRKRKSNKTKKIAYFIHSLKHPDEVRFLRKLYSKAFYLIGVHAHPDVRTNHLVNVRKMTESQAEELMRRDKKEASAYGQQVNETFHLSDFFVGWAGDDDYTDSQPFFWHGPRRQSN